jgi:hypothetical protein
MPRTKPAQEERPPVLSSPLSECIRAAAEVHPNDDEALCLLAADLYCAYLGIPSEGAPIAEA